jgi:hypothetical protein
MLNATARITCAAVAATLVLLPCGVLGQGHQPETERVWGNDVEWLMLSTKEPVPSNTRSFSDLYIIAPVDPNNPQSLGHGTDIGAHDHVIPVPGSGDFRAPWKVEIVLPGPNAIPGVNVLFRMESTAHGPAPLLYAADLDGDGIPENLTSDAKVDLAVELGLASTVDTGVRFVCPVHRIH